MSKLNLLNFIQEKNFYLLKKKMEFINLGKNRVLSKKIDRNIEDCELISTILLRAKVLIYLPFVKLKQK